MKFEWEELNKVMKRAKVHGGWILRSFNYTTDNKDVYSQSQSMVFIPDPNHEWEID